MAIKFKRLKSSGQWAVTGPVTEMRIGSVTINKKDGSASEVTVVSLGKEFLNNEGERSCYGYLAAKVHSPKPKSRGPMSHEPIEHDAADWGKCDNCQAAPAVRRARDSQGQAGHVCIACARGPRTELDLA
jgi:hypothetical protein